MNAKTSPANFWFKFKFHADPYGRMLAKTAHAYACAEVGLANFSALLPEVILRKDADVFRYVGCIGQVEKENLPAEKCLHRISLECWEHDASMFLVVKMRLLAYVGAPEYHVVVGKVSEPPSAAMTRSFRASMISTQSRK